MMFTSMLSLIGGALGAPIDSVHAQHALQPPQQYPSQRHASQRHAVAPPGALGVAENLPEITVYGYLPYWVDDPSDAVLSRLTHLAIFNVNMEPDGSLTSTSNWDNMAPDLVSRSHALGVKVHLCVTAFYDDEMWGVLPYPSVRAQVIDELAELVDRYGADGVNVDFEGLDSDLKSDMVAFVQELQAATGEVYLATPAVDWNGAWDYDELSAASDGMFIMGYGYHWTGGDPGPVAPLYGGDPWSAYSLEWSVEDYLTYGATEDKIILGMPLYGNEWPTTSSAVPGTATDDGWAVTFSSAVDIADSEGRLWDSSSHTPYVLRSGTQLWYDDTESIQDRVQYARQAGIQGVGFWALGYTSEDAEFWTMMSEETEGGGSTSGGSSSSSSSGGATTSGGSSGGSSGGTSGTTGGSGTAGGTSSGGTADDPVALAGQPLMAYPGDTIVLDGSGSYDPDGRNLSWSWTPVAGPDVTLDRAGTSNPTFTVGEAGTYSIELIVTAGNDSSAPDVVDVIAVDPAAGERMASGGCQAAPALGGLVLALLGVVRRRD